MKNMVVCGLGYISARVAQGCVYASNMNMYGFVSSDEEKALTYKEKYNADKIFLTYDEMYADDKVDVVYLATPNHVHYDQIMTCLSHKKHVICEKPMVATEEEIVKMFDYAKQQGCFLMEAEKTFFSPLLLAIRDKIHTGVIGEVYHIQADYNYDVRKLNYPNTHWVFKENGGCALDVGVYPICFAHFFANADVISSQSLKRGYEDYNCDFFYSALIQYGNGISASVKSNWLQEYPIKGYGYIFGSKGYIEVPHFWKDNKAIVHVDDTHEVMEIDILSDFTGEIEHAATCIEEGLLQSPILSEKMSLEILKVIE